VAKRDWNEIEEISKSRKSPIGWEVSACLHMLLYILSLHHTYLILLQPFFNQTLQAGNPRLASTFIPKCQNLEPGAAVTMYEKCGMRVRAAEEAVKTKDAEAWLRLLEAAGKVTTEGREIERLGVQVFGKK
jgi:vacuolar protein sorting-associated protein 16